MAHSYTVTSATRIAFEFSSTDEAEIHAIGLDDQVDSISEDKAFEVYGSQNWGIQDYRTYSGTSFVAYDIPVGQFYTGAMTHLFFANDADDQDGNGSWRNVRVYEEGATDEAPVAVIDSVSPVTDSDDDGVETITLTQSSTDDNGIDSYSWTIDGNEVGTASSLTYDFPVGDTVVELVVTDTAGQPSSPDSVTVTVQAPATEDFIDFTTKTVVGYAGSQDGSGTATVSADGSTITLSGNTWKAVEHAYTLTSDTVLSFEFSSSIEGEIHGIGMDDQTSSFSDSIANRAFQLHGSQTWGIQDYATYTPAGWVLYEIPIGQFYTGSMSHLFFINDHDEGSKDGEGSFRNVLIEEVPGGGG